MDLERMLKDFGKNLGKLIAEKKEEPSNIISIESGDDIESFKIIFNKLIHDNNFNGAEDLLFKKIKEHKSDNRKEEIFESGYIFYKHITELDENILIANDFTRQEAYRGLQDLNKVLEKNLND